jgi:uncharacterized protein (DUF1501 family)
MSKTMHRRDFLKLSAALSALGLIGGPGMIPAARSADFSDYKCLVNVFLLGGNDSFNMLVPRSDAEYSIYAASRQNLAIPQGDLLPISPLNSDGSLYGLHPMASGLQSLFETGDLAIVSNVGPLLEPTSKDDYLNGTTNLPPQLFSHNDQQNQWQSLRGTHSLSTGWAGRIADLLAEDLSGQLLPTNISTSGNSRFQAAETSSPYTVNNNGASSYAAFRRGAEFGVERRASFEQQLANGYGNIHSRALAEVHTRSLQYADLVNEALTLVPELNTAFPDTRLGRRLRIVARLLAVKDEFEVNRQIFYITAIGFDTHDNQNQDQPNLLLDLGDCLQAFQTAMAEIGLENQVTTFTQSDFGRNLTSNGDGTDHGWGAHQLVSGGAVMGRQIYGTMPVLEIDGPDDVAGGRVIPTQSADQYAATLATWFGIPESNLNEIAPSLPAFNLRNLGFMT